MDLKAFKKEAWIDTTSHDDAQRVKASVSVNISYDCDRFFVTDQDKGGSQIQVRLDENGIVLASSRVHGKLALVEIPFDEFAVEFHKFLSQLEKKGNK